MTNNDYPVVLDPVYGHCVQKTNAARLRKQGKEALSYNKARQKHIDRCWTCPGLGYSGCDPRHCIYEKE